MTSPFLLVLYNRLQHGATHDVENLARDLLLTALVILQGQLAEDIFTIVSGSLHRDSARSVLRRHGVKQNRIDSEPEHLRDKLLQELGRRRLQDVFYTLGF